MIPVCIEDSWVGLYFTITKPDLDSLQEERPRLVAFSLPTLLSYPSLKSKQATHLFPHLLFPGSGIILEIASKRSMFLLLSYFFW